MVSPKVFISYSWSSSEHEQRVLDLATQMRESGIDAILDKWDLREGEDADKFMEQMVADPKVTKVLIICDRKYAEKSNKRKGGVGTEAQIISRRVYEQQDEHKFVVASFELDEKTGKPVVPVYYSSRKYIDFTDSTRYAERFEELVRWVYDKPLYEKPKLGKTPDYLLSDTSQTMGTSASFHRVMHLLNEGRSNAKGALSEYLNTFATNLGEFRIRDVTLSERPYYSLFLESIEQLLPYRNEWLEVLNTVCVYLQDSEWLPLYYDFFEKIHAYIIHPIGSSFYYNREEENMRFFEGELLLYFLALLLKHDKIEETTAVLSHQFYDSTSSYETGSSMNFTGFFHPIYSFSDMAQSERSNLISYQSSVMINRARNCSLLSDREVMQADLVAYLRSVFEGANEDNRWYPHTLLYSSNLRAPFPIFARATSSIYMKRVFALLSVNDKEEFREKYNDLKNRRELPSWSMNYPSYRILMNLDKMGTK